MLNLLFGFFAAAIMCAAYNLLLAYFSNSGWKLDHQYSFQKLFAAKWWVFKSVMFEELIFRGALLYLLIRRFGITRACIVSAICFGIYHWFSMNVLGNPVLMFFIFILTGVAGFAFALAYAKNKVVVPSFCTSLWSEFRNDIVFSNGPLGVQLFQRANENFVKGTISLLLFLFQLIAIPLVMFLFLAMTKTTKNSKELTPGKS